MVFELLNNFWSVLLPFWTKTAENRSFFKFWGAVITRGHSSICPDPRMLLNTRPDKRNSSLSTVLPSIIIYIKIHHNFRTILASRCAVRCTTSKRSGNATESRRKKAVIFLPSCKPFSQLFRNWKHKPTQVRAKSCKFDYFSNLHTSHLINTTIPLHHRFDKNKQDRNPRIRKSQWKFFDFDKCFQNCFFHEPNSCMVHSTRFCFTFSKTFACCLI